VSWRGSIFAHFGGVDARWWSFRTCAGPLIYFIFTLATRSATLPSDLVHLAYLTVTGYYQLYFLVFSAILRLCFRCSSFYCDGREDITARSCS
jgi:hypothetical protein